MNFALWMVFFLGCSLSAAAEFRLPADSTFYRQLNSISNEVDFSFAEGVRLRVAEQLRQSEDDLLEMNQKANKHLPLVKSWLEGHALPQELMYLPAALSSLNPNRISAPGRAGWWQLHYLVAQRYGLQVKHYQDERQDLEKSSVASLRYLEDLHGQFGDWTSAILAFIGSPSEVVAARKRSCSSPFQESWVQELPHALKKQFSEFAALAYLFHFGPKPLVLKGQKEVFPKSEPLQPCSARFPIEISALAKQMGFSSAQFTEWNRSFGLGWVPAGATFRMPFSYERRWIMARDTLSRPMVLQGLVREISGLDSLAFLCRFNDLDLRSVLVLNGLSKNNTGQWPQKLAFPLASFRDVNALEPNMSEEQENSTASSTSWYSVKSGDTLWRIASQYAGISPEDLMEWNHLSSDHIQVGQRLLILRDNP